ncbi:PDR/VanB family oxidoreductase [Caldimonas thermodepolymerans]|jgi:ferredoxin-NADP reductase|uniref:Vanillate O-demethylase ferredoxin subunit n=1 Tax=Caldimonas thermodepolymerans TaxID=215580 RepID=A0AA46DEP9_9BURK|nr:PDR/VanB family oxidoreductase [Caldimonas thermodepolymerans]TCP08327.1 vanillate O-demethylase ferredoxin subunit [Caldimonas thermodepolymerans]UZG48560.1 PDR/VanB family oxidoreductase [Caldimonas thermodepolymerans]
MSMQARIRSVRYEAEGILSFRLEPMPGAEFPPFTAGAHIDVTLGQRLVRSYSLLNDPAQRNVYEIAVQLDPGSRGGSRLIHAQWRAGQVIEISEPRNHFPLVEDARHSVLIAGGIGITPMLAMAARLTALDRSWSMHYAVRTRARAAFLDRLGAWPAVRLTVDDEPDTPRLDLAALLRDVPANAHVYCCGPAPMLDAFRRLGAGLGSRLHFEAFSSDAEAAVEGGYVVRLARSGRSVEVPCGKTMLDALLDAGVDVPFACSEGICGTCRIGVLDGTPDHRDQFLSAEEKAANDSIMVCCSGARTATITLDL